MHREERTVHLKMLYDAIRKAIQPLKEFIQAEFLLTWAETHGSVTQL